MLYIKSIDIYNQGFFYTHSSSKSKRILRYNPIYYINTIVIIYTLNRKRIMITLKQEVHNWEVFILNKSLFSFKCSSSKEFWKIYDQKLIEELTKLGLIKIKMIRTKPPMKKELEKPTMKRTKLPKH